MTASFKYALRQLLLISTGDDPDHTASQESTATASTTHTPPAPQARPQTQTAEPVASASGARPVFFTSQVFEWMFQLGWTTPDENGKPKPTNAGFDFIGKLGVPTSGWKNWTPEQQAVVRQAFEQAIADQKPPELPDMADPFE
jgi:hypothetical protein